VFALNASGPPALLGGLAPGALGADAGRDLLKQRYELGRRVARGM
jgi:hypothetical protein